jgi:hypothetical protein
MATVSTEEEEEKKKTAHKKSFAKTKHGRLDCSCPAIVGFTTSVLLPIQRLTQAVGQHPFTGLFLVPSADVPTMEATSSTCHVVIVIVRWKKEVDVSFEVLVYVLRIQIYAQRMLYTTFVYPSANCEQEAKVDYFFEVRSTSRTSS